MTKDTWQDLAKASIAKKTCGREMYRNHLGDKLKDLESIKCWKDDLAKASITEIIERKDMKAHAFKNHPAKVSSRASQPFFWSKDPLRPLNMLRKNKAHLTLHSASGCVGGSVSLSQPSCSAGSQSFSSDTNGASIIFLYVLHTHNDGAMYICD